MSGNVLLLTLYLQSVHSLKPFENFYEDNKEEDCADEKKG